MVKGTANRISSTASSPAVHPSTRHGARRFDCPQAAGSVPKCTRAPARRDCRRPCHPTRLIPGRLPQNRQLPRPRRWRARSPRLLGARAARCARLVRPRALSAIRSPLLHSRALPPWLRVLCASRRVTFLRRGTTAVSPTSSSSARAAAPPSTAAAAAAAAAATAVRGPVPLLFRPSVRLNRPPLVLSGARGAAQTWRGRMHRGLRDAGRAGASGARARHRRPSLALCCLHRAAVTRARARPLSRRPGPPCCACSCPARCWCRCRRPGPAPSAAAARRRDRAARRRVCRRRTWPRERRRAARVSRARRCSGARSRPPAPAGHRAPSPTRSAPMCARPDSPARSRRPPRLVHPCSFSLSSVARGPCLRRGQAVCASGVAGGDGPGPAPPRGHAPNK